MSYSNEGNNYPLGTSNVSPVNSNPGFNLTNFLQDNSSGIGNIASGLFGAFGANNSANNATQNWNNNFQGMNNSYWNNVGAVDNFAPVRPMALQQLLSLQSNPNQYLQSERFQTPLQMSMEAMRRKQAQTGMLGSGNSMAELQELAQTTGLKALTDRENQLSKWAGGDFNLNQVLAGDASMRNAQMSGQANFTANQAGAQAQQDGVFGSIFQQALPHIINFL